MNEDSPETVTRRDSHSSQHSASSHDDGKGATCTTYPDGSPALLLNADGSGIGYYEGGKVAVVVACVPTPNGVKYQRYFYHNDTSNTLICSLDEHAVGFSYDQMGKPEGLRMVLTHQGGVLSNNQDRLIGEWKWDKRKQGAGTTPTDVKIQLNHHLSYIFRSRMDIQVTFRCGGQSHVFQCGQQLRRTDSYLDNCTRVRSGPSRGKVVPNFPSKTLVQRQAELVETLAYKRSKKKPSSRNIRHHHDLKVLLESLEDKFSPYVEKVRNSSYIETYIRQGWKAEAHSATMREVPRLAETGTETGENPNLGELGCTVTSDELQSNQQLLRHSEAPKKWPTELQVRERLRQRNPALVQSAMFRAASGRYSRDSPVKSHTQPICPLPVLSTTEFDEVIDRIRGRLVVVVCLRHDDPLCVRARQLFELVLGEMVQRNGSSCSVGEREEDQLPMVDADIYEFHMSESRLLNNRFGVQTLPAYLMFYNSELVKADVVGSRKIKLAKEQMRPRLLLLEKDYKSQLVAEALFKRLGYESELALNATQACNFVQFRSRITSSNAVTFYGCLFIDASLSVSEARTVASACRKQASNSAVGAVLVVSILPMGCVPNEDITEGIIDSPSSEQLLEGLCDAAITRPIKSSTLDALCKKWRHLLIRQRGAGASLPLRNVTHYGFTKEDLIREMQDGLLLAQKQHTLPPSYRLGMKLPASDTMFRGVKLDSTVA